MDGDEVARPEAPGVLPGRDDGRGDGHDVGRGGTVEDPLLAARVALEGVADLPLADRAEVFEEVHATVVEELRRLELG